MSNLIESDMPDTGMALDGYDGSQSYKWDPVTIHTALPKIREYCKEKLKKLDRWKTAMTGIVIIMFIMLFYLSCFAGQLQRRLSSFGKIQ